MKTTIVVTTAACLLALLAVQDADAAPGWFDCEVHVAGSYTDGRVFIQLTDVKEQPAFRNKFFLGKPELANEMLAIALVAISTNKRVRLFTDPEEPGFPLMQNLYLIK